MAAKKILDLRNSEDSVQEVVLKDSKSPSEPHRLEPSRIESIIDCDFVKSLGTADDFANCDRVLFSLDNAAFTIVVKDTLPKLVDIFHSIMKMQLELRVCVGGYQYADGQFSEEISFLIKMPLLSDFQNENEFNQAIYDFNQRLYNYLVHYTRQESYLMISRYECANIAPIGPHKPFKYIGKWKRTDEAVAKRNVGYTQIGNYWFIASYPDRMIKGDVSNTRSELAQHSLVQKMEEKFPYFDKIYGTDKISWLVTFGQVAIYVSLLINKDSLIFLNVEAYVCTLEDEAADAYEYISKIGGLYPWPIRLYVDPRYQKCFAQYYNNIRYVRVNDIQEIVEQCETVAGSVRGQLTVNKVKGFIDPEEEFKANEVDFATWRESIAA